VVDNEWSMREYGHQAVVWQTALNPEVALELLASRAWSGWWAVDLSHTRRTDRCRLPSTTHREMYVYA